MYPRWLWPAFALPGVVWLLILFVLPFYAVVGVAFGSVDPILLTAVPAWNPLNWNFGWVSQVLTGLEPGGSYWDVFIRTVRYVVLSLGGCILIGYPVAYYISRHASRTKSLVLLLLVLPFWISYLMRMLAWINLLSPGGWGTRFLHDFGIEALFEKLGLLSQDGGWLNGQASSVVIALVYGYIPYLILPLYAALDRIDQRHIEAARDLGASPFAAFRRVTLPLSVPGILAGAVLIALPMFGDYYTQDLISASPRTSMNGNQIDGFARQGSQKTVGAVLTILLAAVLLVLMFYYLRTTRRADLQRAR